MLDFDLAELYGAETKRLKEAVRRNKERFPVDFMFQLTQHEFEDLRSQFASSNKRGGIRYMPFAFTQEGVGMLSGILNSDKAIKMHIAIIRAFIALKRFAVQYADLVEQIKELKDKLGSHDAQLNQIYDAIENLLDEKVEEKSWQERKRIGFKQ